ncbi:MAG: hypothetical protein PVF11_07075, partial [Desulfobacterales bacterium]
MKPTFKFSFYRVILFALAAILTAPVTGAASEPIIIGIPHSEAYTYAKMMKTSLEMALESINKAGGIKGQPLKL